MMSALHNRREVFGESASVSKIQFINTAPGKQSGRAHWPRSQEIKVLAFMHLFWFFI